MKKGAVYDVMYYIYETGRNYRFSFMPLRLTGHYTELKSFIKDECGHENIIITLMKNQTND